MQGIFISYRRQDSQSAAGRLADHLKEHMRGVPIFRDVETIEPGVDFVDAIDRALRACGVLLAVIGPRWLSLESGDGKRRLDDPNDYTRLEIATALRRDDVRVIPVLVEGAEMPPGDRLPDDLKALSRRNAIELTDKRWEYDVSQLVDTLHRALDITPAPPPPAPPHVDNVTGDGTGGKSPRSWWARWPKWQWGVGIVGLLILAAMFAEEDEFAPSPYSMPIAPVDPAGVPAPVDPAFRGATASTLSGDWRDVEGGVYRIEQRGNQIAFQGMSPHGPVSGRGLLQGDQLTLEYLLDDEPYQASLRVGANGASLQGQYFDPLSGESGQVSMQRVR